jgi:chorismate synthase
MNSFGRIFRVSIFGESHGPSVGIVIDGCPPGIPLKQEDFEENLNRRRSGAKGTTPRTEPDTPELLSGVFNDKSTGAPITILFRNTNTRSGDYSLFTKIPRPGHADFVAREKYKGFTDYRGGGHFSGRLTLGLVAAGVLASKVVNEIEINARLIEAGGMKDIEKAIDLAVEKKDSIGGIVECVVSNVPAGLGEPFFDSAEAVLSHLLFSIPAIKGVEFGAGFAASKMHGSEHNDSFIDKSGKTETNHAGGINGGITNSNDIVFRVAVKPTSSTSIKQQTVNIETGEMTDLEVEGRHDLCIALRVPVVVESVTAIAMADFSLLSNAYEQREK